MSPSSDNVQYLRSPAAIRERAGQVLKYVEDGRSQWFALDSDGLEAAVQATLKVTRDRFSDPATIPFHSRWRHFEAGGHDRWASLAPRFEALSKEEVARRRMDLAIVSVLLDAGAGAGWSYREPGTGETYARSEGLGVASFHMFANGAFSRDPKGDPLRVDAERLSALTPVDVALGFQVKAHNPLLGLEGRAELLRKLGSVGLERPGALFDLIAKDAAKMKAASILAAVLDRFSSIWPSRLTLDGQPLGDVWRHPAIGLVPFHKLSQWMSYSLVEPLQGAGLEVVELDALTGLPEYRNGGLLIDAGALRPKQSALLQETFAPGDEPIVEWRALTVALLDRVAEHVRLHLGMDAVRLPLVKVLEAGTWFAGRRLAAERRAGGGPPIAVASDGTVF
ncbi:Potential Queuosine, Q, salvage protein family [Enhydrobacter aerosaccus]|uniref:Potential Queuosine, Q, salvage protein family n=1 Tax=Enhydrobacter aerosaccus TaxID=225324 RepID=A0A1T4RRS2_9HYPH|nr:URC4/urg3 family protein [Enhydrobacter aerosaccus]SKA18478.1 Potential Queuosine, Q, salvage protein family [Enhydrobacter aerosaccus]